MNKIKNFFCGLELERKSVAGIRADRTDSCMGHPEGKRIHADHDTDKQSEPGTGSER